MFDDKNDTLDFRWLPMKKAAVIQESLNQKQKEDTTQMALITQDLGSIKETVGKMWSQVEKDVSSVFRDRLTIRRRGGSARSGFGRFRRRAIEGDW